MLTGRSSLKVLPPEVDFHAGLRWGERNGEPATDEAQNASTRMLNVHLGSHEPGEEGTPHEAGSSGCGAVAVAGGKGITATTPEDSICPHRRTSCDSRHRTESRLKPGFGAKRPGYGRAGESATSTEPNRTTGPDVAGDFLPEGT